MEGRPIPIWMPLCASLIGLSPVAAQVNNPPSVEAYAKSHILIRFKEGVSQSQIDELHKRHGLKTAKRITRINVHKLTLPPGMSVEQAIAKLENDPLVDFVEPNYRIQPFADHTPQVAPDVLRSAIRNGQARHAGGLRSVDVHGAPARKDSAEVVARDALAGAAQELAIDASAVRLLDERESASGRHVRFQQAHRGVPVYGSLLSVHMDRQNRVRRIQARTRVFGDILLDPTVAAPKAVDLAREQIVDAHALLPDGAPELMLYLAPSGQTHLIWRIALRQGAPQAAWEVLVDAHSGSVLHRRNQVMRFDGTANVFDPSPTTWATRQDPPLPVPTHGTDVCPEQYPADATDLSPYVRAQVAVTDLDGTGFVQNANIKIVNTKHDGVPESSNPDYATLTSVANSPTFQFEYAYDDASGRFEEAMAYYHLQTYRTRLMDTLGYAGTGLLDGQVIVDVHAVDASGNDIVGAFGGLNQITIGDEHSLDTARCRELAEEGDVLVHEYAGHVLYADIHPTASALNPGLEEGWADFFSASYFDDPIIGEWSDELHGSGHRRNLDNELTLADWQIDFGFGPIYPQAHDNGEIWGGTLWKIRERLMDQFVGGTTDRTDVAALVDTLFIESLYFFSPPGFADYYASGTYSPYAAILAGREGVLAALDALANLDPADPRYDARYAAIDPKTIVYEFAKRDMTALVPNDPYFDTDWTLQTIKAPEAWGIQTGREDVVVGVVDFDMVWDHEDFAADMFAHAVAGNSNGEMAVLDPLGDNGTLWSNEIEVASGNNLSDDDNNGYADDLIGWDFGADHNNPWQISFGAYAHGVRVAGVIGAKGNDGVGTTGVNWDSSLMFLNMSSTDAGVDQAADAQLYALDNGARLVNASWGIGPFGEFSQTLYESVKASAEEDMLFVAAAGNSGSVGWDDLDANPLYPQKLILPNMIVVTALNEMDEQEEVFGRYSVDLGSPTGKLAPMFPTQYGDLGQTSGATPHVTGAIALLLAEEKDRIDANPGYRSMTMGEIRYLLLTSVDRLDSLINKCVSEGRLNVHKLLLNYIDSDMDGYSDRIEALFDTDPNDASAMPDLLADDDGDGLSNGDELANGTMPRIPSGNLLELVYPLYLEHNADGTLTGELLPHLRATDPDSTRDSDGDGLSDFEEAFPAGDYIVTDPANPDSDGDGLNDSEDPDPLHFLPKPNDGDVAPLGSPDGRVNAADVVVLQRMLRGDIPDLTADQIAHGDLNQNGGLDAGDLVMLIRLVTGNE